MANALMQGLLPWGSESADPLPRRRVERRSPLPRTAFDERRLGLACQPVVDLADGRVLYQEALARLSSHPTQSRRTAFIARLESEGSIHQLDAAVLRRGVVHLARNPWLRLGVNLSCRSIDALGPQLPALIEALGPLAARLVLEITETAPIADRHGLHRLVDRARAAGCAIAFDDFGAGWFALADIVEFRPEIVKIDGTVFKRAFHQGDFSPLAPVRELAATQPMLLVAEHIESLDMAQFARGCGIPYAQGFHFAEPCRMGQPIRPGPGIGPYFGRAL